MSTTTTTAPSTASSPRELRPFHLHCPMCGEHEANILVDLGSLDGDAFKCGSCEADFSVETVRTLLARWGRLLAWLDAVPQDE